MIEDKICISFSKWAPRFARLNNFLRFSPSTNQTDPKVNRRGKWNFSSLKNTSIFFSQSRQWVETEKEQIPFEAGFYDRFDSESAPYKTICCI